MRLERYQMPRDRLSVGLIARGQRVGAWRLTGSLGQRVAVLRDAYASRASLRLACCVLSLAMPLRRAWRGLQEGHSIVGVPVLSVALHARFTSRFMLAAASVYRREIIPVRHLSAYGVCERVVRTERTVWRTEWQQPHRHALTAMTTAVTRLQRDRYNLYRESRITSETTVAQGAPPLYVFRPTVPFTQRYALQVVVTWPVLRLWTSAPLLRACPRFAPTAISGTAAEWLPRRQSPHTILALLPSVMTMLSRSAALRASMSAWLKQAPGVALQPLLPPAATVIAMQSRTLLTHLTTSSVRDVITHAFSALPLYLPQRSAAVLEPLPPRALPALMPLLNPARTAMSAAPVSVEHMQRQVAERVIERVEGLVEREVHRHMRFDSQDVRRLREHLYADLGSQIVFERERLGRG